MNEAVVVLRGASWFDPGGESLTSSSTWSEEVGFGRRAELVMVADMEDEREMGQRDLILWQRAERPTNMQQLTVAAVEVWENSFGEKTQIGHVHSRSLLSYFHQILLSH